MINFEKSSITFGNRVYQHTRNHIMQTLRIHNVGGGGKYLGLPEQFGRKKKEMLQFVKDSVQKKISGWQTRFLTEAGKETLIKAVAYAMPVYSMNVFQLPMELCSEIDSMMARFWWGSTQERKKNSWVSWQKMGKTKKEGGMGFRNLHLFNQALLANQAWKLIQRPESLVFRMLKARYFREGKLITASRGSQPSYGWNSLRFGCELLRKGIQISIGNGVSTLLGKDPWLPTNPPRPPSLLPGINPKMSVKSIIDQQSFQWDENKLSLMIQPEDHHIIRKIYLPTIPSRDTYLWSFTKNGAYTVKSGYWTAVTTNTETTDPEPPLATHPDIAASIWSLEITPKLKHFLWRTASRAIGVAENLRRRNINVNPYCSRCCIELETSNHVLFSCPFAETVWRNASIPTNKLCDANTTLEEKLRYLFLQHKNKDVEHSLRYLPFWIMWRLWKSRNDMVFNHKTMDSTETLNRAITDIKEWMESLIHVEHTAGPNLHTCRASKWSKPKRGWVKCNYDASHHAEQDQAGMGWIIRDAMGNFLDCGMGKYQGRITTEEAECTALIWALQSTWALGYRTVEFEGDNMNITRHINGENDNLRLRHYLQTITNWKSMFTDVKIAFTHREHNKCADSLARRAISCFSPWSMYHSCPLFLSAFVNIDNDTSN